MKGVTEEKQQEIYEVAQEEVRIQELVMDMYQLIGMGAYESVIRLSRKYTFFHAYDVLIPTLIYHGRYELTQEALHDLMSGPLFYSFHEALTHRSYPEFLSLPRLLYLVDYVLRVYYLQESDPFTRLILEYYEESPDMMSYAHRIEQSEQMRVSEDHACYVLDQAFRYGLVVGSKFEEYCVRNHKQFLFEQYQKECENSDHHQEIRKYELLSACHGGQCTSYTVNPALVALALNNISEYVYGEAPAQYETSLLKLDFQTIYGNVEREALVELLEGARVFEVVLYDIVTAFKKYDVVGALEGMSVFVKNMPFSLYGSTYTAVALYDTFWKFVIHVLSHASYEQRNSYEGVIYRAMPVSYRDFARLIQATDEVLFSESVKEMERLAVSLFENSKIIIR